MLLFLIIMMMMMLMMLLVAAAAADDDDDDEVIGDCISTSSSIQKTMHLRLVFLVYLGSAMCLLCIL